MRIYRVLLVCWIAACLWVLYAGLAVPAPVDVKDVHVGMSFWMVLLTFPCGLLVFLGSDLATVPFGNYFGVAWSHHPGFYWFMWTCFFVVGLVQWLVLLPFALRKLRARLGVGI